MTAPRTWPDRAAYSAAVQNAATCFDVPDLRSAQYFKNSGGLLAWSGGRAIVFHATYPSGRGVAIRFLTTEDHNAEARYRALGRHLDQHPLPAFVRADWVTDGLRWGQNRYPLIVMDWVEGKALDRFLAENAASPSARGEFLQLASTWQRCCTSMSSSAVGHGDIHAGNILVTRNAASRLSLRLIDYDNVSLPGVALARHEDGNAAFQHPARSTRSAAADGGAVDALGNTLTYLSLRCLADDPRLWHTFYRGDDLLLFSREDLADTTREVWTMLRGSADATVRSVAELTCRWLREAPHRYESLDQVISAARAGQSGPTGVRINVWNPRLAAHTPTPLPPATPLADDSAFHQQWPPVAPSARTTQSSGKSPTLAWLAVIMVLILIVYVLTH